MYDKESHEEFTYWKRPWHKWLILVVAAFQLLSLWLHIQEYHEVISAGIFSSSILADYTSQKYFQCAISGLMTAIFFGTFIIGTIARNKRIALLSEGLLLLLISVAWGIAGIALGLFSRTIKGLLFWFILLVALGGVVYNFWRYRKE